MAEKNLGKGRVTVEVGVQGYSQYHHTEAHWESKRMYMDKKKKKWTVPWMMVKEEGTFSDNWVSGKRTKKQWFGEVVEKS